MSEIQIVFFMSGYDEFYGRIVRERSYGFIINPCELSMLVCVGGRQKKSNSFFILGVVKRNPFLHEIEWKNNGFLFTTLNILTRMDMKKEHAFSPASQLREYVGYIAFLDSMFLSGWFFHLSSCSVNFLFLLRHFFALLPCGTSRWFSFDRPTSLTSLHDTFISITDWKLKLSLQDISYPDPLIRELIFSLAFLFRLPLDSASWLLIASFNGLLFSTSSITLFFAPTFTDSTCTFI